MSPEIILLLLRIFSAVLLLLFVGTIGWYVYKDLRFTQTLLADRDRKTGALAVVSADFDGPIEVGDAFPLIPVTRIGRTANNTIVLQDEYVSGQHALITMRGDQWWLEDLSSRNGTSLNDILIEHATVIENGDLITIGRTTFRVNLDV